MGSEVDPSSVFEEIRRARSETSRSRALVMRLFGLVILALAVWVVSRNVAWDDTLRLERTGEVACTLDGRIEGDWRAEAVDFHVDEGVDVRSLLVRTGFDDAVVSSLAEALSLGHALRVTEDAVTLPGGQVVIARSDGSVGAGAVARRIEWRPGMVRALRDIDLARLAPALGFLILASLCVTTRWWRLLKLGDCPTRWYDAFRYTYSGLFFNAVVPGINGGDVARAVAVVRNHPDRRGDALMTVVVDRALGLVGMVLVGTALVLTTDERLHSIKLPVTLFCVGVLVAGALFLSSAVRRFLRFETLVARLPQGERILRLDAGARMLLRRPGEVALALVLSFGNHVFNGFAVYAAASALGSELGFQDWMTTMAIANTIAALPLSPGGLGVGEVLFGSLAELLGSTYALGVATSLVYRLCLYAMSLLGGLVMLLPSARGPARGEALDRVAE